MPNHLYLHKKRHNFSIEEEKKEEKREEENGEEKKKEQSANQPENIANQQEGKQENLCLLCSVKFSSSSELETHMLVHLRKFWPFSLRLFHPLILFRFFILHFCR